MQPELEQQQLMEVEYSRLFAHLRAVVLQSLKRAVDFDERFLELQGQ